MKFKVKCTSWWSVTYGRAMRLDILALRGPLGHMRRIACISGVQRRLDVEPGQHIQQEVPIRTHVAIDERRQRSEILHGQPRFPGGLPELLAA